MRKLKWITLFSLGLVVLQANAEQPVVIDEQTIGEQPAIPASNVNGPAQGALSTVSPAISPALAPTASPADENKERILKGGKMSPKQKAEIMKADYLVSNKREGDAFLLTNRAKPGVHSLPSGVQYRILRSSKGRAPTDNSIVVCRYQGTLIDGSTFDKSDPRKPLTLKVDGLLPGLKEAVKLMPTGSKWQIIVPPQLGYGERGNQGVGPNAVLIYDMEIISVK